MSGAQQHVSPWVFSSIHPWLISLARGAASSSAPSTVYPCLHATSLCYINSLTHGMQIVVFDISGFCALLCMCLNAGVMRAGDTASGLLAEADLEMLWCILWCSSKPTSVSSTAECFEGEGSVAWSTLLLESGLGAAFMPAC